MCTYVRFTRGLCSFAQTLFAICMACFLFCPDIAHGTFFPFDTTLSSDYLLIARDSVGGNTDVDVSNFELGAIKAPVPATDKFLSDNFPVPGCSTCGGSGGPTLAGAVPDFPTGILAVVQGVGGHGNIAVMDVLGEFNLQNVGVYADPGIGIRVAGPDSSSINKSGDSFFNDPSLYPNTFDIPTQSGVKVSATDPGGGKPFADPTTRIDHSNSAGVTYGFDHSGLATEIYDSRDDIIALGSTGTLDVSTGSAGILDTSSIGTGFGFSVTGGNSLGGVDAVLTLNSGLNVIDIITGSNDFKLDKANFVIDGPADAAVVFRLPGNDNMLIDNSNILAGNGGIGVDAAIFFSAQTQNDTHFNMNNVIINGVAFWSFGLPETTPLGTAIEVNNAQGYTQLIADKITLSDVRLTHCSFGTTNGGAEEVLGGAVPEPTTYVLGAIGLLSLGFYGWRRKRV